MLLTKTKKTIFISIFFSLCGCKISSLHECSTSKNVAQKIYKINKKNDRSHQKIRNYLFDCLNSDSNLIKDNAKNIFYDININLATKSSKYSYQDNMTNMRERKVFICNVNVVKYYKKLTEENIIENDVIEDDIIEKKNDREFEKNNLQKHEGKYEKYDLQKLDEINFTISEEASFNTLTTDAKFMLIDEDYDTILKEIAKQIYQNILVCYRKKDEIKRKK